MVHYSLDLDNPQHFVAFCMYPFMAGVALANWTILMAYPVASVTFGRELRQGPHKKVRTRMYLAQTLSMFLYGVWCFCTALEINARFLLKHELTWVLDILLWVSNGLVLYFIIELHKFINSCWNAVAFMGTAREEGLLKRVVPEGVPIAIGGSILVGSITATFTLTPQKTGKVVETMTLVEWIICLLGLVLVAFEIHRIRINQHTVRLDQTRRIVDRLVFVSITLVSVNALSFLLPVILYALKFDKNASRSNFLITFTCLMWSRLFAHSMNSSFVIYSGVWLKPKRLRNFPTSMPADLDHETATPGPVSAASTATSSHSLTRDIVVNV